MSSSGLIYAVIVGAWAAYLVPMWLRRQDELNEARPTERFSTAIRLLSGRAGMERRYAKDLEVRAADDAPVSSEPGEPAARAPEPEAPTEMVDVRPFGMPGGGGAPPAQAPASAGPPAGSPGAQGAASERAGSSAAPTAAAARARRTKVLARRRRTTVVLFLAFTLGAVVAGVGGLAFLWVPAVPAALLSAYIVYLRLQERRRFAFTMDQRRAELAAQRLREGRVRPRQAADPHAAADPVDTVAHPAPAADHTVEPSPAAGRRALVEQTDHAEWVDQQRDRGAAEGWDPVPVPLPTYVTAPVAPRAGDDTDLGAPDAWSSARSSTADPAADRARAAAEERRPSRARRRPREGGRTPLFDQYADDDRPRAANE
ncbi:gephyrin-like molybdotransferase receptor GlpR [Streptomyces roseoverticillatus]|uniref:divisome protein SepX/GlpR n=1 Tax=Streptomyces roseoverticillatus TaxID=66429 RepID=UPI0004C1AC1F|nr:gephyrin-like molybdotransferase receptor GlpR [Streptomyces roseoverticillatus]